MNYFDSFGSGAQIGFYQARISDITDRLFVSDLFRIRSSGMGNPQCFASLHQKLFIVSPNEYLPRRNIHFGTRSLDLRLMTTCEFGRIIEQRNHQILRIHPDVFKQKIKIGCFVRLGSRAQYAMACISGKISVRNPVFAKNRNLRIQTGQGLHHRQSLNRMAI